MARTTLTLPDDLAAELDDLLPWAKHRRYVKRSDERNDLIRYLLQVGVQRLRAEVGMDRAQAKRKPST